MGRGESAIWVGENWGYRPPCGFVFGYGWLRLLTFRLGSTCCAAALWLTLPSVAALTRYLIVVHGARRMSSWSRPIMLAPLRLRTPTTLNDTFCTRTSLPTGDSPPNSSLTKVWPKRQTLLPLRT